MARVAAILVLVGMFTGHVMAQSTEAEFHIARVVYSSGNYGYGIVFAGNAHDISVFDTRVGLGGGAEIDTASKLPNGKGGVLIGRGTYNITIGGPRGIGRSVTKAVVNSIVLILILDYFVTRFPTGRDGAC